MTPFVTSIEHREDGRCDLTRTGSKQINQKGEERKIIDSLQVLLGNYLLTEEHLLYFFYVFLLWKCNNPLLNFKIPGIRTQHEPDKHTLQGEFNRYLI